MSTLCCTYNLQSHNVDFFLSHNYDETVDGLFLFISVWQQEQKEIPFRNHFILACVVTPTVFCEATPFKL